MQLKASNMTYKKYMMGGVAEYKMALANVSQQLRETGSALKAIAADFAASDHSEQAQMYTLKQLNNVLQQQKDAYNKLQTTYTNMRNVYAQNESYLSRLNTYETVRYNGYNNDVPDQQFKRLNVTWGVGAGFQYRRYFLRGGYDFGLINPYKNADFTTGIHSRGRLDQWSIKIGMYLWYYGE